MNDDDTITAPEFVGTPAPASILQTLATLPSGEDGPKLSLADLGDYLRKHVGDDKEIERNRRHALRDELYRDGGIEYMKGRIDHVFVDSTVRELRKKWVEIARYNNPIKRIVNELSTVYVKPAKRTLRDDAQNEKYAAVLDAIAMDESMLKISRLLNLHRAMLVGFRVRQLPNGVREPVLSYVTPANCRAVLHPNDDTLVIGWLVRCHHRSARTNSVDVAAWTLWTEFETLSLRADMSPIIGTYAEHGLGVNPWVAVTLTPPDSGFWPGQEGEDLVAAHTAIWMQNILLLKESKSATKQTVLTGDGTTMARGQAADTEVPTELADGQGVQTVDMSMDLDLFRKTAESILDATGNNYGMSPAIMSHQGVQSAEARDLMRVPLRELREQQQIPLRRFEHQLAVVMAAVLKSDLEAMAFDPDGWRIDFGEAQTPQSMVDLMNIFIAGRSAGTTNTVDFLKDIKPGITDDEAMDLVERNVLVETWRNAIMRPLKAISGSPGATTPGAEPAPDSPDGGKVQKFGAPDPAGDPEYVAPVSKSGPIPHARGGGMPSVPRPQL